MQPLKWIILLACLATGLSCKKDALTADDCQDLKTALAANDKREVTRDLDHLLLAYSKNNLEQLTAQLGSECDITATLTCYDCIFSNPPSSEIRISFNFSNSNKVKFLNIAPDINNKMQIMAIHD